MIRDLQQYCAWPFEGGSDFNTSFESFGDEEREIARTVLEAAQNRVLVLTKMRHDVELCFGSNIVKGQAGLGFGVFGSHPMVVENPVKASEMLGFNIPPKDGPARSVLEAVQFDTLDATNPELDEVIFRYSLSGHFNANWPLDENGRSVLGSWRGNSLNVAVELPETAATQLADVVVTNPSLLREIIHELVVREGGVPENVWMPNEDQLGSVVPVRPPYEYLPIDHKIALY